MTDEDASEASFIFVMLINNNNNVLKKEKVYFIVLYSNKIGLQNTVFQWWQVRAYCSMYEAGDFHSINKMCVFLDAQKKINLPDNSLHIQ